MEIMITYVKDLEDAPRDKKVKEIARILSWT